MMIQETYHLKPLVIETVDILNGDFESWPNNFLGDWEADGSVTKTDGHTGFAARLTPRASISQTCKISGGHEYELTAWLSSWFTLSNVEATVIFDNGGSLLFHGTGPVDSWSASKWRFTVPDDVNEVTFLFETYQYAEIDDVSCALIQ